MSTVMCCKYRKYSWRHHSCPHQNQSGVSSDPVLSDWHLWFRGRELLQTGSRTRRSSGRGDVTGLVIAACPVVGWSCFNQFLSLSPPQDTVFLTLLSCLHSPCLQLSLCHFLCVFSYCHLVFCYLDKHCWLINTIMSHWHFLVMCWLSHKTLSVTFLFISESLSVFLTSSFFQWLTGKFHHFHVADLLSHG